MLHPLFTLLIRKPELVVEHLAGYGALIHEEVSDVGVQLVSHIGAWMATLVMAIFFIIMTGMAIMLGCVLNTFHWALVLVPGFALLAAIACFLYARTPMPATRFDGLKAQIEADVQSLRIAGERK